MSDDSSPDDGPGTPYLDSTKLHAERPEEPLDAYDESTVDPEQLLSDEEVDEDEAKEEASRETRAKSLTALLTEALEGGQTPAPSPASSFSNFRKNFQLPSAALIDQYEGPQTPFASPAASTNDLKKFMSTVKKNAVDGDRLVAALDVLGNDDGATTPPALQSPHDSNKNSPRSSGGPVEIYSLSSNADRDAQKISLAQSLPSIALKAANVIVSVGSQSGGIKARAVPIALVHMEGAPVGARLVATNEKYYAFPGKGGVILVGDRFSTSRAQLIGHRDTFVDVQFSKGNSDVLASTAKDGSLYVWRLTQTEDVLSAEVLACAKTSDVSPHIRIAWHKTNPDRFVTANTKGHLFEWDVQAMHAALHLKREEVGEYANVELSESDALNTWDNGAPVSDIVFSPWGQIITASDDGRVRAFDHSSKEAINTFVTNEGRSVNSLHFTSKAQLITIANRNSEIALWNIGQVFACVQRITLEQPSPHLWMTAFDDTSSLLFLANTVTTDALCFKHFVISDSPSPSSSPASSSPLSSSTSSSSSSHFTLMTHLQISPVLSFAVSSTDTTAQLSCVLPQAIQSYSVKLDRLV